jgi:hypothetical protein
MSTVLLFVCEGEGELLSVGDCVGDGELDGLGVWVCVALGVRVCVCVALGVDVDVPEGRGSGTTEIPMSGLPAVVRAVALVAPDTSLNTFVDAATVVAPIK